MSDSPKSDERNDLEHIADTFGTSTDPLEKYEDDFATEGIDPFVPVIEHEIRPQDYHKSTFNQYTNAFDEWKEHMEREGRHPACPTDQHVIRFIEWQLAPESDGGKGNQPSTVKGKLRKLNTAYEFWQEESAFPHPTNYNPFKKARKKKKSTLKKETTKGHRRISIEELREMLAGVTNLRKRAVIGIQFKLGLRAGEVRNIKLSDLNLADSELQSHFSEMGAHGRVADRPNAIYIPNRDERPGNKSKCYRVLPLDDELRRLLKRYLLVRPDNGEPWLFLSETSHSQLGGKYINEIWKDEFHPEYAETDEYRPVTSHFGRHYFATWWRSEKNVNRDLLKYMRGDAVEEGAESGEAIDAYIHTNYDHIEDLYLEGIYKILR